MPIASKLLKTIRLDASDTFVFERAARSGEWAVTGTFIFWDDQQAHAQGKARNAFRSGFLGLETFGWSTLAVVVEASPDERASAVEALAAHLVALHGAPDLDTARAAAADEINFSASLAEQPSQTLVAIHRGINDGGEITEQFRTFHAGNASRATSMPCSAGAFAVVEDDGDPAATDAVDFADLLAGAGPSKP
jgi:Family of unknown function (DUF6505)